MSKNIYFLLCTLFVFAGLQAKAEVAPSFTGGHIQHLTVCENAAATSINNLLVITDPDFGQTETWTVVTAALHGSAVASAATSSSGGIVTPVGLSYTPTAGYAGNDSFVVRIYDGYLSDTTIIHVLINPLPTPIAGVGSICRGLTSTLSDIDGGGVWTSSNTVIASVSSTGVVTAAATGNAVITYTLPTGCKTTTTVTVNAMPNAISGSTYSACTGGTFSLADVGGGTWSSNNPSVATINSSSGYILAVSADTTTIRYTLSTGCFTTAVVTINQTPAPITGVSNICMGNAVSFGEAIFGGVWSSSNTGVATITSGGILNSVAAGTTTITYSLGACSVTKAFTVNAVAPVTGNQVICVGGTSLLSNINGGGSWSSAIPGVAAVNNVGLVSGIAPGNAVISYTLPTGCISQLTMTINPVPLPIVGATHICVGNTLDLTDGDGGGGWSSSNTTVATIDAGTGIVTGLTAGTPTITYSFNTGCKVTTLVTINALPLPIGGALSVCAGLSTTLTETGGGTWTSANTSVAIINSATGMATGISAGAATIVYTLPTGCNTSVVMNVNPAPDPIYGSSAVCVGAIAFLTETASGGGWNSNNTSVATISALGAISGLSAGTTTITYAIGSCIATKSFTVNPIAPITGAVRSACVGGSFTLADAVPGGTWSSASPGIAVISTMGQVTGITPGNILITYSLLTGCFTSASITINPNPDPIAGVGVMCNGSSSTLTDAGGGTWSSGNTLIATVDAAGVVTGRATGNAVITFTLGTGCRTTTTVTINPNPSPISGILTVCTGLQTGLVSGTTGTWSSGSTLIATVAPTGYVTGIVAGIAPVTYTLPDGCFTSVTVTVNPTPGPISSPASVCQGDTTVVSDALLGGVWSSSSSLLTINSATGQVIGRIGSIAPATINYNVGGCSVNTIIYVNPIAQISGDTAVCMGATINLNNTMPGTWSTGNATVATVTSAGVVHGLAAGNDMITYTFTNGCRVTHAILVNAQPGPIEGTKAVCINGTTELSDSIGGGVWSTGVIAIAVIDPTGVVTANGTGVTTITYTLPGNCRTTALVTVNPYPYPILGHLAVCAGSNTQLYEGGAPGVWSSGSTALATVNATTGMVNAVAAGNVTITYSLSGCDVTAQLTINPLPAHIVGASAFCRPDNDTLSESTPGGAWTTSNQTVAYVDSAAGIVRGHVAGVVTITYTLAATGCYITKEITVNACSEGVAPITTNSGIVIAPNPSRGDFTLKGSLGVAGDSEVAVALTNIMGQTVYTRKILAHSGRLDEQVQVGNIANGTYLLQLQYGNEHQVFHLVIQQ